MILMKKELGKGESWLYPEWLCVLTNQLTRTESRDSITMEILAEKMQPPWKHATQSIAMNLDLIYI